MKLFTYLLWYGHLVFSVQSGCARHHHLILFSCSWHIQGSSLTSCRIGTYVLNALCSDITWVRQKSICPLSLSNHVSRLHINRQVHSPFQLWKSRSSHLWSVICLLSHLTRSTFSLPRLLTPQPWMQMGESNRSSWSNEEALEKLGRKVACHKVFPLVPTQA